MAGSHNIPVLDSVLGFYGLSGLWSLVRSSQILEVTAVPRYHPATMRSGILSRPTTVSPANARLVRRTGDACDMMPSYLRRLLDRVQKAHRSAPYSVSAPDGPATDRHSDDAAGPMAGVRDVIRRREASPGKSPGIRGLRTEYRVLCTCSCRHLPRPTGRGGTSALACHWRSARQVNVPTLTQILLLRRIKELLPRRCIHLRCSSHLQLASSSLPPFKARPILQKQVHCPLQAQLSLLVLYLLPTLLTGRALLAVLPAALAEKLIGACSATSFGLVYSCCQSL